MGLDNSAHRGHAGITDFHIISVKQFSKFVVWREVFIDEPQDLFANVGRHIKAVWWVEPNDLSASASTRSLDCRGNKLGCSVVSTASKGSAVRWYCFVKLFLIARQGLDPVRDGFRKLLYDVRRMVRFGIDIQ